LEYGTGRIVFYDPKANFGFIEPDDGSGDVVFSIRPGDEPLDVGEGVAYELIPKPAVTQMGTQALRVWRVGFAPMRPGEETSPEIAPAQSTS
jgi:cold shock CspA family protein